MAAFDPQQPLVAGNPQPQVIIIGLQYNVNANAGDYVSNFRKAMKDSKNNCGLQAKNHMYDCSWCCSCCSLWRAAHFWTFVFVALNIYLLVISLMYIAGSYPDLIAICCVFFGVSLFVNLLFLYGVYHCIPWMLRTQHIVSILYEWLCIIVVGAAIFGQSWDEGDAAQRWTIVLVGTVAFFVLWYPIHSFYKLYKWAQYYTQIGTYDPNLTIYDVIDRVGTEQCCN